MISRPWAAPEVTALRRLPMHAIRHPDRVVLDGTWRFQLVSRPEQAPASEWRDITVPGCWTMQGTSDYPHYTNVQMPFPNLPPEPPLDNPTGVYERSVEIPASWAGRRIVLHVGAAESVLLVEVDGALVRVHAASFVQFVQPKRSFMTPPGLVASVLEKVLAMVFRQKAAGGGSHSPRPSGAAVDGPSPVRR